LPAANHLNFSGELFCQKIVWLFIRKIFHSAISAYSAVDYRFDYRFNVVVLLNNVW